MKYWILPLETNTCTKKPSLIVVKLTKGDKSIDSKEEHSFKKSSPTRVTLDKAEILEIVFKDEHRYRNTPLISVTFTKGDKSTDSKEEQQTKKYLSIVVTFDKAEILKILVIDEHLNKKLFLISVTFVNGDKSTNSKEEHSPKK
eukprot:TRINITY_DN6887_c0_g1_i2.p2 TRINITY_DN6887_c0_g1~~TRINITY_DN6887_c0_g1_i2.p2  ORF type:complete len:144 (-),score=25.06 TRINITY_DN6887_c0_g1_i2:43-474(-)